MSVPVDEEWLSWLARLCWNLVFGLVWSFVGRLSEDMVFSVASSVFLIGWIVAMICRDYAVNRRLVLFYLSTLSVFIQFLIKDADVTTVERLDKIALLFYGGKFLLDVAVWVTGSRFQ